VARYFAHRLGAAAEVLGQELLGLGVEVETVFRPREAVAFVGVDDIFHRLAGGAQRFDDLIAFGLLDARVVGALTDEERRLDAIDLEERRPALEELWLLLEAADALVEEGPHRRPVRWNGLQQRYDVAR